MSKQWIDFHTIKKVLVAKLRHHGDVLLAAPVFSALKYSFPHLEIDAYLYGETLPMLLGHPAINDYLLCCRSWRKLALHQRLKKEAQLLWNMRCKRYDLVINLTEGDRGALAAKMSGCRYAVGYNPQGKGMWRKKSIFTHLIDHGPYPRHTVEKNLDALRCLGLFPDRATREIFFHLPEEAMASVREKLASAKLQPGHYVHIHPVSRWMFKSLPPATVAKVIVALYRKGKQVVLTASKDPLEIAYNAAVRAQINAIPVLDLSGCLSLKELAAVLAQSELMISVDSVTVHLSSALKKPVVAVFGPTCDRNWAPWRNAKSRVIVPTVSCRPCYCRGCGNSGTSDCLTHLAPDKIIAAAFELLGENR
ncbi:MAG: putative lipopolysaccharide heptosyltransferase III [Chlamydiota bacterium]